MPETGLCTPEVSILELLMRRLVGVGTPRGLQGRLTAVFNTLCTLVAAVGPFQTPDPPPSPLNDEVTACFEYTNLNLGMSAFTTVS